MGSQGKIRRLPHHVREELNQRLLDGATQEAAADWLNRLPEVQRVCAEYFGGGPVNRQNISAWRKGGFVEWEARQDKTRRIKELARFAVGLSEASGGTIAAGAGAIASGKILELLEAADGAIDLAQLKDVVRSLASLRNSEISQQRTEILRTRLRQQEEALQLAHRQFDQRLREYQDKVAAQKREIESALTTAHSGGITPETLRKIEEAAKLL